MNDWDDTRTGETRCGCWPVINYDISVANEPDASGIRTIMIIDRIRAAGANFYGGTSKREPGRFHSTFFCNESVRLILSVRSCNFHVTYYIFITNYLKNRIMVNNLQNNHL